MFQRLSRPHVDLYVDLFTNTANQQLPWVRTPTQYVGIHSQWSGHGFKCTPSTQLQ